MPAAMTRSKVAGEPSMIDTRWTIARTPRAAARSDAGSVTSPRTSSQSMPASADAPRALRTSARTAGAARDEVAGHVPADEAAGAGDEDHDASAKFCQYLLGVGPR